MVRRPTKPEAPDEKDPMQVLLETLQKNSNTMNKLLVGLNQMTKANQAKNQEKSPEELAIYRERLALLQERRKQAEIDTKRREEESKKVQKDDYKNNIVYRAGTNIAEQKSSATSAMALSVLTGGLINPVIAKTFGMDKLLSAGVNFAGRGLSNVTNITGRSLLNAGKSIKNTIFNNNDEEDTENKGKTKKRDSSAVAIDKDKNPKIEKALEGIKANTDKLVGKTPEEAKEEKSGFFDSFLVKAKVVAAILGLATGMAAGFKLLPKIQKSLADIAEFFNPKHEKHDKYLQDKRVEKGLGEDISNKEIYESLSDEEKKEASNLYVSDAYDDILGKNTDTWKNYGKPVKKEETLKTQDIPLDKKTKSEAENDAPANLGTTNGKVPLNAGFYNRNDLKHTSKDILSNVQNMRNSVIDPLQEALTKEKKGNVIVTSSYRSPRYNSEVGGVSTSKHLTGKAMDIQVPGMSPEEVIQFMKDNKIPFERAIAETDGTKNGKKWVHVEYDTNGKHSGLVASLNAHTKKYTVLDPGQNNIGTAKTDIARMETQNIDTPEDFISTMTTSIADSLQSSKSNNPIMDVLQNPMGNMLSQSIPMADIQNTNIQPAINIMSDNNAYNTNAGKAGTVYAYGDVAKTAILHTI